MLLAVDVGNTNVTIGVFDGAEMVTRFHFTVRISRTSDEYGSTICEILERKGFSADSIDQVIIRRWCLRSCIPSAVVLLNISDVSRSL